MAIPHAKPGEVVDIGLPRLLLGSVADKVIRGASVPVLVHRSPAQEGKTV
jgi:hypothetical protein